MVDTLLVALSASCVVGAVPNPLADGGGGGSGFNVWARDVGHHQYYELVKGDCRSAVGLLERETTAAGPRNCEVCES